MIDAHCHVDMFRDPSAAARAIERGRIDTVAVTNLPSHYELGKPHVADFQYVHLALGLHPLYAKHHADELPLFDELAEDTAFIGEVGMDFSREGTATRDLQTASFERVLTRIAGKRRFVTLHSRGAEKDVLAALKRYAMYPVVFHWYSGTQATLEEIAADGHFFSVNTAMVGSDRGKRLVALIPRHRLLTESDGPHIKFGGKAASPRDMGNVEEAVAQIWEVPSVEVAAQVANNFAILTAC